GRSVRGGCVPLRDRSAHVHREGLRRWGRSSDRPTKRSIPTFQDALLNRRRSNRWLQLEDSISQEAVACVRGISRFSFPDEVSSIEPEQSSLQSNVYTSPLFLYSLPRVLSTSDSNFE